MAAHNSLQVGDEVVHMTWPHGVTATVVSFGFFQRYDGARVKPDYGCRYAVLDREIDGDDAWMESGLLIYHRTREQ